MKKCIAMMLLLLVAALLLIGCEKPGLVQSSGKLSELSFEEQLSFLKNADVTFPDSFPAEEHEQFIKMVIKETEDNAGYMPVISNPVAFETAKSISRAVNEYYDRNRQP